MLLLRLRADQAVDPPFSCKYLFPIEQQAISYKMCEIIVMTEDRIGDDFHKDIKLFKRGDVLCVVADGWNWSQEELTNPLFRIIKLPNLSVSAGRILVATEQPTDPYHDRRLLRQRMYTLNLAHPLLDGELADHQIHHVIAAKIPVPNPNAIGLPTHEIGLRK